MTHKFPFLPIMLRVSIFLHPHEYLGCPHGLSGKESSCHEGGMEDTVSVPEQGKSPGGGHGDPLQYSCLENPRDREAWWAAVHGVTKRKCSVLTTLSTHEYTQE